MNGRQWTNIFSGENNLHHFFFSWQLKQIGFSCFWARFHFVHEHEPHNNTRWGPEEGKIHNVTWHSIMCYQTWVRWLLCNDIIPKAIPLSQHLPQCSHLVTHVNTKKVVELARTHRLQYTYDCSLHIRDRCMGWHWQLFHSQSKLWASARVPAGSVPSTQPQKREVGTITLWPHACFIFDWNMTYQLGLWQKPTQFDCE